jgi:4-amino-4-deoxy-L-arabinose transferase-like glycosyltransferase
MSVTSRRFVAALLVIYVAKQIVAVLLFPPFTGHDEVAHFQNVRVFATEGRPPTLFGDTLPPDLYRYRPYSIAWKGRWGSPLYTAIHPPLYYTLVAPIYRATAGMPPEQAQYILRFAAIPFGAAVVVLAYLLTRAVFPRDGFLAVTVPAVVAFQPQVSYSATLINNDIAGIAMVSLLLYLMVLVVRDGLSTRRALLVGAAAGLALLAKATALLAVLLIPVAFWMGRREWSWAALARALAITGLVTLALIGPWWWFMARTYGDPMALSALATTQPEFVRDEPFLNMLLSGGFLVERWQETWGEFGWKLIHIGGGLTAVLAVVTVAALAGLATYVLPGGTSPGEFEPWQTNALLLLGAACVLSYLGMVQFGIHFTLTQARYYFPAVNGGALLVMLGLEAWIPARWRVAARAAIVLGMIAVNVVIYTSYVVPYWYFRR